MANDNIVLLRHLKLLAVRCSAMVTSKISELTTAFSEDLAELDDAKQDALTFDSTPTEGSTNPVTSDGVAKFVAQTMGTTARDEILFSDRSTGTTYSLYVTDGELQMVESTSNVPGNEFLIADRSTNITYSLYVMDGKLTMEESEG